jgi:hypothetical protein
VRKINVYLVIFIFFSVTLVGGIPLLERWSRTMGLEIFVMILAVLSILMILVSGWIWVAKQAFPPRIRAVAFVVIFLILLAEGTLALVLLNLS